MGDRMQLSLVPNALARLRIVDEQPQCSVPVVLRGAGKPLWPSLMPCKGFDVAGDGRHAKSGLEVFELALGPAKRVFNFQRGPRLIFHRAITCGTCSQPASGIFSIRSPKAENRESRSSGPMICELDLGVFVQDIDECIRGFEKVVVVSVRTARVTDDDLVRWLVDAASR